MRKAIGLIGLLLVLQACNSGGEAKKEAPASENDMDAARNFIRAALDGKWSEAGKFMLRDSLNVELLDMSEGRYEHMGREEKRGYRESSIQLFDSRQVGDSITIVSYANSFMNKKDSLKVVHLGNQWLIDLKYSLLPTDTTKHVH